MLHSRDRSSWLFPFKTFFCENLVSFPTCPYRLSSSQADWTPSTPAARARSSYRAKAHPPVEPTPHAAAAPQSAGGGAPRTATLPRCPSPPIALPQRLLLVSGWEQRQRGSFSLPVSLHGVTRLSVRDYRWLTLGRAAHSSAPETGNTNFSSFRGLQPSYLPVALLRDTKWSDVIDKVLGVLPPVSLQNTPSSCKIYQFFDIYTVVTACRFTVLVFCLSTVLLFAKSISSGKIKAAWGKVPDLMIFLPNISDEF